MRSGPMGPRSAPLNQRSVQVPFGRVRWAWDYICASDLRSASAGVRMGMSWKC
jgi:hypothetical protein